MKIYTLNLDSHITVRLPGAPNPEGECIVHGYAEIAAAIVSKHERFECKVSEQVRSMPLASTGSKFAPNIPLEQAHV